MSLVAAVAGHAQLRKGVSEQDRSAIVGDINTTFGSGKYNPYSVDIMNIDSSLDPNEPLGVSDPHNLLERCYIFLAVGKMQDDGSYAGGIVGVYRGGNIVWHSPPIINSDGVANAQINTVLDLNNDGKPDIVTDWQVGMHGEADYIWIFSWDGHNGTPLNLWDTTGYSNLVSYTDDDQFVDLDGDGVLEIKGKWQTGTIPGREISVLYAWNGQNYVSVDTSAFSPLTPPPRNLIKVTVDAKVKNVDGTLYFSYVVENSMASLQKVNVFMLMCDKDSVTGSAVRNGWDFVKDYVKSRIVWMDMAGLYLLTQGRVDTFAVKTTSDLPGINSFYAQGQNGKLNLRDIYTNSVHGLTVSPTKPPSLFAPVDFLDTLISYKHRSVALGWLSNDKTRERECEHTIRGRGWYRDRETGKSRTWKVDDSWDFDKDWNRGIIGVLDKRLEKAKQALSRGDSVKARRELQIFVMEVELVERLGEKSRPNYLYDGMPPKAVQEARSKKSDFRNKKSEVRGQKPVMTSEAYALLKYNAEYLIDRLPGQYGRHRK